VHGDILEGNRLREVMILAGFYLASQLLHTLAGSVGLRAVDDHRRPATCCGSAAGAVSLVMVPVAHAMSRTYRAERRSVRARLTRNPGALHLGMRRLGAQNLAEDNHPGSFSGCSTQPSSDS